MEVPQKLCLFLKDTESKGSFPKATFFFKFVLLSFRNSLRSVYMLRAEHAPPPRLSANTGSLLRTRAVRRRCLWRLGDSAGAVLFIIPGIRTGCRVVSLDHPGELSP